MKNRLPLLVLLLAAAAPVSAGPTDFETSLLKTMQESDSAAYQAMAKECAPMKADEAKYLACVRQHLAKFTQAYEARVKDAKVDPKKGLVGNLDPVEQTLIGQAVMTDADTKKKWEADQAAAKKDADAVPGLVAGYRTAFTGLTTSYRSKPAESTRAGMTTQIKGAKEQLKKAGDCMKGIVDGKPCTDDAVASNGPSGVKKSTGTTTTEQKTAAASGDSNNEDAKDKSKSKAAADQSVPPAPGDLVANPDPAKPDPNRWNDTIAGAKGAIYGGLLGFIFGGPMGMFVFAMVGFAAMYGISKMNNS